MPSGYRIIFPLCPFPELICPFCSHTKTECPNERVEREFTGTCRICEEVGHRGADCPSKGPTICKRCNLEGKLFPLLTFFPTLLTSSRPRCPSLLRKVQHLRRH